MKQKKEKYPVSKEKLYGALQERGLSPSEASKQMGYERNYLPNVAAVREIPRRGAIILERLRSSYRFFPFVDKKGLLATITQTLFTAC